MKSRKIWLSVLVGLCVILLVSCGDDDSPTSPAINVVDFWSVTYDWNCDGDTGVAALNLKSDGTFETIEDNPAQGTWNLQDNQITMTFSNGTIYTGTVDSTGTSMEGTMVDSENVTGCWTATRSSS